MKRLLVLGAGTAGTMVVNGVVAVPLDALRQAHEGWFPGFMDAKPPA